MRSSMLVLLGPSFAQHALQSEMILMMSKSNDQDKRRQVADEFPRSIRLSFKAVSANRGQLCQL